MSNRPIPQENELYKHYANHKTYKVLGVSFEANDIDNIQYWAVDKWGTHKKTGEPIAIYKLFEGLVFHDGKCQLPNHVAYQSTDPLDVNQITNTVTIWVTPLDEFMAILGDEKEGTHYYRFTKVS